MQVNVLAKWGLASSVCLLLAAGAPPTRAQAGGPLPLTPAQTLRPADLTPVEMDQYRTLDPAAAKDFIATRSYVRLCSRVVDGTLPAMQLPARPAGFKADDLLGRTPPSLTGPWPTIWSRGIAPTIRRARPGGR